MRVSFHMAPLVPAFGKYTAPKHNAMLIEARRCFDKGLDRRSKSGIVFFLMVC
jgi:hypothetical protein